MEMSRRTSGLPRSMVTMTSWCQEDRREARRWELRWSGYYHVSSHNNIEPPYLFCTLFQTYVSHKSLSNKIVMNWIPSSFHQCGATSGLISGQEDSTEPTWRRRRSPILGGSKENPDQEPVSVSLVSYLIYTLLLIYKLLQWSRLQIKF